MSCTKKEYPTKKRARMAINALKFRGRKLYPYRCRECRKFHLTSQPPVTVC